MDTSKDYFLKIYINKIISSLIIVAILSLLIIDNPLPAKAAYTAEYLIADSVYSNGSSMSAGDINNFFRAQGASWFTDYVIPEYVDVNYPTGQGTYASVSVRQDNSSSGATFFNKTLAQLIADEAQEHSINPQVMISILQKESSSITQNPFGETFTGTWPLFYGFNETIANCWYNGTGCDVNYNRQQALNLGGIGCQVAFSMAFLRTKYEAEKNLADPLFVDNQTIYPQSVGTRVFYKYYTPHLRWQTFYSRFTEWFGEPTITQPTVTYDDTNSFSNETYADYISISGSRSGDSTVYVSGSDTPINSGSGTWQTTLNLNVGVNNFTIIYNRNGSTVAQKSISINHHKAGDINGDEKVNLQDLSILSANWGKTQDLTNAMANLNPDSDNVVDILDLSILASHWEG